MMYKERGDCDILLDSLENTAQSLGQCFNDAVNENKTKMNVVGSIFGFGSSLTKLAFETTSCAIRNTPKAIVAVHNVKRSIIESIEEEENRQYKEKQKNALDEKIKNLKLKSVNKNDYTIESAMLIKKFVRNGNTTKHLQLLMDELKINYPQENITKREIWLRVLQENKNNKAVR